MKVFVCIDDNNGMLFNGRRQSRDAEVVKKMLEISNGKVHISPFSSALFGETPCIMKENFLDDASDSDFCFVENVALSGYADRIDTIILFRWNRAYPYDMALDINPSELFCLKSTTDFAGNSHENITMEVWEK